MEYMNSDYDVAGMSVDFKTDFLTGKTVMAKEITLLNFYLSIFDEYLMFQSRGSRYILLKKLSIDSKESSMTNVMVR